MSSKSDLNAPSWDEFRVEEDELDYEEEDSVCEPNNVLEYGPTLPPGFRGTDGGMTINPINDFAVSEDNYDEPDNPKNATQNCNFASKRDFGLHANNSWKASTSKNLRTDDSFNLPSISSSSDIHCPCSSKHSLIGPSLPSEFSSSLIDNGLFTVPKFSQSSKSNKVIGPCLPNELLPTVSLAGQHSNGFNYNQNGRSNGAILPPEFCDSTSVIDETSFLDNSNGNHVNLFECKVPGSRKTGNVMELPLEDEENSICEVQLNNGSSLINHPMKDEDDIIGPVMPSANRTTEDNEMEFFYRLAQLEARKAQSSKGLKREEWMTELPQKLKQGYGLSAKSSFSRVSGPESSSNSPNLWTQAPNSSFAPSSSNKIINSSNAVPKSVKPTANKIETEKKESLMDMHNRKRKLNNKNEEATLNCDAGGRRPFNREIDMEVRGLSNMTSEEAKNRVGDLETRFQSTSSTTTKKFL